LTREEAALFVESPSPQTSRKPSDTFVDATLALDKPVQRVGIRLAYCRVPHEARPLASGSLVHLRSIGGPPDDSGEWIFPPGHIQSAQSDGVLSSSNLMPFGCPPGHQRVHRSQVPVDRIAEPD
jgi:hypothetical protein